MESIKQVSQKVKQYKDNINTEQSTIQSLIMPFFQALGYDTYNPLEVVPEFTADIAGISNKEKVDIAIMMNGKPLIVIECKSCNTKLEKHSGQLTKYFNATDAKFAILTNGIIYQFFTDLDKTNIMDTTPFLEFDILNMKDELLPEIMKFHKNHFDTDNILNAAQELKYTRLIKEYLHKQTHEPDKEFVRMIIRDAIYADKEPKPIVTQKMIDMFMPLTKHSFVHFLNEQATERLQAAIHSRADDDSDDDEAKKANVINEQEDQKPTTIETTLEELEGYAIVKSILRDMIDADRLTYRHAQKYMVVLFDNNKNKRICRLWFKGRNKYITTPDENMNPVRHDISSLNDIYKYSDSIREVCSRYI